MNLRKIVTPIIVIALIVCCIGCFSGCSFFETKGDSNLAGSNNTSSNNDGGTSLTENIIIEDVAIEDVVIADEYVEELILVEEEIAELLLEDESITDVVLCQTLYVEQSNIDEFAQHSSVASLFAENVDWEALLTKVAIGTGVIVTLTVLKCVGFSGPVGSIVAAAAPAALKGAAIGAGIGSITGALTGATDAIDGSGRTSAIVGFSLAVVGVVLAAVSLAAAIPSGGSSSIGVATGVKIAIAGISLAAAVGGAGYAGYNMVKTITSTNAADVDWENIDWEKVGVTAAAHAIEGTANGYVWGSVIGAIYGGAEGLEYYEIHGAPYSSYKARIDRTPVDGERGHWTGERGESTYVLEEAITTKNGAVVKEITYKNGIPDFKDYQISKVEIRNMTDKRYNKGGNFEQANKELAKKWTKIKYEGKENWTVRDVSDYIDKNNLTWHEMNNMHSMQLVPTEVNSTFGHLGGVSEYKTMAGSLGGTYD